ncbi:MAG TPA: hypothetical protein VFG89_06475 [Coriobacteriia bacterium]|nr:hypothetical protein [Coriobacteriia bacterium]
MPQPPRASKNAASPASARRTALVIALTAVLVLGGVAGVTLWALNRSKEVAVTPTDSPFTRYKPAWSSALAKAGVEGEFPDAPVDVTKVHVTGRQPFEAEFTAEEATALMSVYRFAGESSQIDFSDAQVAFPAEGTVRLDVVMVVDNTPYHARAVMPLTYDVKGVHSDGLTSLSVEGFGVGGEKKRQASDAVIAYLNEYLRAIPGVTVEEARIAEGVVAVKGTAPVRIENP